MKSFAEPVSKSLRATRALSIEGTCGAAALALRHSACGLVPVTRDETYVGAITEDSLRRALAEGVDLDGPLAPYVESVPVVPPYATGAEALRRLNGAAGAVVVDDGGVIWGLLFPSDLFPKPPVRIRPPALGGMAVPYGVHLTAGVVAAGPGQFGLLLTGAALVSMIIVAQILAFGLKTGLEHVHAPSAVVDLVWTFGALPLFAAIMRFSPIAGYHAAEHQVVHAIERLEPLTVAAVSRMPRVHPRCGTNFAVGVILGSTIALGRFGIPEPFDMLQFPLGLAIAVVFWRRLGGIVQYWITTRPASRRQLEAGIRSGEALISKYESAHSLAPNPWKTLWNMGLLQVAVGGMIAGTLIVLVLSWIGRTDVISF